MGGSLEAELEATEKKITDSNIVYAALAFVAAVLASFLKRDFDDE